MPEAEKAARETISIPVFSLLTDVEKAQLDTLFTAHSSTGVPLGGNAQTVLLNIFDPGTTTRTDLIALATENISRGVELGLGFIHSGDVIGARAL